MSCPTKYNRRTVKRLLSSIARGLPLTLACDAAGISHATFSNWRRERPRFAAAVLRAIARGADERLRKVEAASAQDWRAAAWLLEHTLPQHFAKSRLELSGPDGGPIDGRVAVLVWPHQRSEVNGANGTALPTQKPNGQRLLTDNHIAGTPPDPS
jgi:hypothetical protein